MNSKKCKITLTELKDKKGWSKAVIVFKEDSFSKYFTEEQRSYEIDSGAKYFDSSKISHSLFGSCLDGTDKGVRLDWYMHSTPEDNLGKPWVPEYCYILE